MPAAPSPRDVTVGLVVAGSRVGAAGARLAFLPLALAARVPLVGSPLRRAAEALADDGRRVTGEIRAQLEALAEEVLAAPEVERAIDRALAGPLAEAVAHSLGEHRVVERVAAEMARSGQLERALTTALEHEATGELVEVALASPGLERLFVRVLESRMLLELTDRVLASAEMQHALRHVAESPELRRAIAEQSSGLAEEMAGGVRRRTGVLDDAAEKAVRGWLRRRPRSA
jgi:hypothetical protein